MSMNITNATRVSNLRNYNLRMQTEYLSGLFLRRITAKQTKSAVFLQSFFASGVVFGSPIKYECLLSALNGRLGASCNSHLFVLVSEKVNNNNNNVHEEEEGDT